MPDVNAEAQALKQGEEQIETDIDGLGSAVSKEIADCQAVIQADLQKAGVDPAVVEALSAKFTTLQTAIANLTSRVTAADPGSPVTPIPSV